LAKRSGTNKLHFEQINLALTYIHDNLTASITAKELAVISGYSIFHFHRIFKELMGENVNEYIKNTRLERASNLLLYNQHKTIQNIAIDSGFTTATGFSSAFKNKFGITPKEWRNNGYDKNKYKFLESIKIDKKIDIGTPTIVSEDKIPMVYMRVYSYENNMIDVWNHIYEWCNIQEVLNKPHRYIGLFLNHPSFTFQNKMRYLACIQTDVALFRNGKVGKCVISEGKFAKFNFFCKHQELYKLMHLAYVDWLSNSNYEVRNFPAYVEYKNLRSLLNEEVLEVDFYMPIQLKI